MKNPIVFLQQVRNELARVVWPTRKELTVTTIMVFIMVLICAIYFMLVDTVLSKVIRLVLGLKG